MEMKIKFLPCLVLAGCVSMNSHTQETSGTLHVENRNYYAADVRIFCNTSEIFPKIRHVENVTEKKFRNFSCSNMELLVELFPNAGSWMSPNFPFGRNSEVFLTIGSSLFLSTVIYE